MIKLNERLTEVKNSKGMTKNMENKAKINNYLTLEREDIIEVAEETSLVLNDAGNMCEVSAKQADALLDKLRKGEVSVAVIGQFKRGKSRLSNSILGDDIMPTGIVPITSAATRVVYGESKAQVIFENGKVQDVDFAVLDEYISEQKNSNNMRGVKEVVISSPSQFLKNNITYIDTPGVGSLHIHNTTSAYAQIKESDAVIFLLSVDSPINQIEMELLENTKEFAGKFYFAVNKIDMVDKEQIQEYISYCSSLIKSAMNVEDVVLHPVSAKTGEGVDELKDTIMKDISDNIRQIMISSIGKKFLDIISNVIGQLRFYREAMRISHRNLDDKFLEIESLVTGLKEEATSHDSNFTIHLNDAKLALKNKVEELFNVDYYLNIEQVEEMQSDLTKKEYIANLNEVCDDISAVLKSAVLYREENAFIVVRLIEDMNKTARRLRSLQNRLSRKLARNS